MEGEREARRRGRYEPEGPSFKPRNLGEELAKLASNTGKLAKVQKSIVEMSTKDSTQLTFTIVDSSSAPALLAFPIAGGLRAGGNMPDLSGTLPAVLILQALCRWSASFFRTPSAK